LFGGENRVGYLPHATKEATMPRIPEKDRAALPKPILKQSALGLYPVNAATVSWLHQGLGELIVEPNPVQSAEPAAADGVASTPVIGSTVLLTGGPAGKPVRSSKKGSDAGVPVALENRAYRGLSSVLYRGKLPQVILAIPDGGGLNTLIQEIMDHLYKIEAMGSLLSGDPVNSMVPCIVLLTPGVIHRVFMDRLNQQLATLHMMPESMLDAVRGRILRGQLAPVLYQTELMQAGRTLSWIERPTEMRLAGGTPATRTLAASVLQMNGVTVANIGLEAMGKTAYVISPERLELEQALQHLASRLPAESAFQPVKPVRRSRVKNGMADPIAADTSDLVTGENNLFAHPLLQSVLKLGRRLNVFQTGESCEDILGQSVIPQTVIPVQNSMPVDQLTLLGLAQMAQDMGMPEVRTLYRQAMDDLDA